MVVDTGEKVTIRVTPRVGLFRDVYARRHGYSEFYVGVAFTMAGGIRKARRQLAAEDLNNSCYVEVETRS